MSTNLIIMRKAAVAVKEETTAGIDSIAGTPASGDWLQADCELALNPVLVENPAYTGSLDTAVASVGGFRPTLTLRVPFRGSGTAGTPPTLGRLLKACTMALTQTASAVGAPTAAASGTTTTITAATPFGTTAQQYRGMPILLAGNPAAGATDVVLDYTAGRVVTLGNSYSPVLSTSTTLQIPVNVLYSPTSDESLESWLTAYVWGDEMQAIITGCKASRLAFGLRNGAPAMMEVTLTGQVASRYQNVTRPAGYVAVTRSPPLWRAGASRLNRALANIGTANFDAGLRTAYPDNPEATQGYDPPLILGASPRITIDPLSNSTNTPLRAGAMDANTPVPFVARWGSVAGNRFALSCPSAVIVDLQPQERSGLGVDAIALAPDLPNAGMFLACF